MRHLWYLIKPKMEYLLCGDCIIMRTCQNILLEETRHLRKEKPVTITVECMRIKVTSNPTERPLFAMRYSSPSHYY